jgi:hypothetical protein
LKYIKEKGQAKKPARIRIMINVGI